MRNMHTLHTKCNNMFDLCTCAQVVALRLPQSVCVYGYVVVGVCNQPFHSTHTPSLLHPQNCSAKFERAFYFIWFVCI